MDPAESVGGVIVTVDAKSTRFFGTVYDISSDASFVSLYMKDVSSLHPGLVDGNFIFACIAIPREKAEIGLWNDPGRRLCNSFVVDCENIVAA